MLSSNSDKTDDVADKDTSRERAVNIEDDDFAPMGFGRGRGRGRGGRGLQQGRGFQKDAKGPDWDCPVCGNVNWSWRANCNKCQTAKPVTLLTVNEVRDGAGGGFNERQDRASSATLEITEDGFDDFGRRAKGGSYDRAAKEAAALARLSTNYSFLLDPKALASAASQSASSVPSNQSGAGAGHAGGRFDDADGDLPRTRIPFAGSSSTVPVSSTGPGSRGTGGEASSSSRGNVNGNGSERERDRERAREREADNKHGDRDRDREREGGGRDRERDRERDRDRDRESSRRERSRSRDRDRDSGRRRDR